MNPTQYSEEEIKDITERTEKAIKLLGELNLYPTAQVLKVNMGDDVFGDKVIAYLQDNKYKKEPIKSPFSK